MENRMRNEEELKKGLRVLRLIRSLLSLTVSVILIGGSGERIYAKVTTRVIIKKLAVASKGKGKSSHGE
jgi:hypothetical protein